MLPDGDLGIYQGFCWHRRPGFIRGRDSTLSYVGIND